MAVVSAEGLLGHIEHMDFRIAGKPADRLKILVVFQKKFHIGLTGSNPDITKGNIRQKNGRFPRVFYIDLERKALTGRKRRQCEQKVSAGICVGLPGENGMKASGSGAVSAVKISSNSCKGCRITINMDLLVPLEDHAALKKSGKCNGMSVHVWNLLSNIGTYSGIL